MILFSFSPFSYFSNIFFLISYITFERIIHLKVDLILTETNSSKFVKFAQNGIGISVLKFTK